MDNITVFAIVLIAACLLLALLPPHLDPAIRWKERHIQPEMRSGRKNWQTSDGKKLDYLPTRGGKLCCPDCGQPTLLSGPQGGLSQNVACDNCHSEFNIGLMDSPPLIMERFGKLTEGRARIYGITPAEIMEKSNGRD